LKRKTKLQVTVDWKKYISVKNVVLNKYLEKYGDEFLYNVLDITQTAIKRKVPAIVLIQFQKSDIISVAERSEYPLVLQRLMELCLYLEKYELCQRITDVRSELINKNILPSKRLHAETILI
jgi:hypothetical protein